MFQVSCCIWESTTYVNVQTIDVCILNVELMYFHVYAYVCMATVA